MAVYNQEDAAALRRGVRLVLMFAVIVAAIWLVLWFVFFRGKPAQTAQTQSNTDQSQSADNKSTNGSSDKDSSKDKDAVTADGDKTTPEDGKSSPNELAETGPGNVLLPAVAATVVGTAVYQVRLRRKARG